MNEMPRCSTCRWWKQVRYEKWSGVPDNIIMPVDEDTYEPKEMPFEVRYCTSPKLLQFERPVEPDGFSVVDGSMYHAELVTAGNFGCIHHEPAPEGVEG